MRSPHTPRVAITGGLLLGLGLGGFFDGIVLHQLLQWHHMICEQATCAATSVADLERKTFYDGLFHLGCLILSTAGAACLVHSGGHWPRRRVIAGAGIGGWGLFNFVEGLIDHQILNIHHVRFGPNQFAWDMTFLASGLLLALFGWFWARSGRAHADPATPSPGSFQTA